MRGDAAVSGCGRMTGDSRFAPSPSGPLHLGHAYSAVQAAGLAGARGGRLRLRIDDIDGARSRAEHVASAIADLAWLGVEWAAPLWRQSDHLADYAAALDKLIADGLAYPCFCTRADIAASLAAPHGPSGAAYPGTCRRLSAEERAERTAAAPFCWRIDMARAGATAGPLVAVNNGEAAALDPRPHGDVVIARKDAPASYHLASTIDDAAMGIGIVVRGVDLLPATAVHVLLQKLLGLPTPEYHHHALLCGADGVRLAKRDRPATLAKLRAAGMDGPELAHRLRVHQLPAGYSLAKA
jgi:glutamyl-Q tRNA(Asp) synthetase